MSKIHFCIFQMQISQCACINFVLLKTLMALIALTELCENLKFAWIQFRVVSIFLPIVEILAEGDTKVAFCSCLLPAPGSKSAPSWEARWGMVEVDPPSSSAPSSHNNRPTPQSTPLCSLKDGHNFVCPSFVEFVTLGTVLCYSYLPRAARS